MVKVKHHQRIYALYRGDHYLCDGTRDELAARFNVKPDTINYWSTPSYKKRIEQPGHNKDASMVAEMIGFTDEDWGWHYKFRSHKLIESR